MKKGIKKYIPLIVFLLILGTLSFGLIRLSAKHPEPATVEQVKNALVTQGLKPEEFTKSELYNFPNDKLIDSVTAEKDDLHFQFYIFDDAATAADVYGQAHSIIYTTRMATPKTEVENKLLGYRFYVLNANGTYSIAILDENTVLYAYCNSESLKILEEITDEIGYGRTELGKETNPHAMGMLRVGFFTICFMLSFLARSWFWDIVYKSAGVKRSTLNKNGNTKLDKLRIVIEKSKKPTLTKILVIIYELALFPALIAILLAVINIFTTNLNDILNKLSYIVIGIMISFALISNIINKLFFKK